MSVERDDDHNPFGKAPVEKKKEADPFDPDTKPANDPFAGVEDEVEDDKDVGEEIGSRDA